MDFGSDEEEEPVYRNVPAFLGGALVLPPPPSRFNSSDSVNHGDSDVTQDSWRWPFGHEGLKVATHVDADAAVSNLSKHRGHARQTPATLMNELLRDDPPAVQFSMRANVAATQAVLTPGSMNSRVVSSEQSGGTSSNETLVAATGLSAQPDRSMASDSSVNAGVDDMLDDLAHMWARLKLETCKLRARCEETTEVSHTP
jgi:hypothetical protein